MNRYRSLLMMLLVVGAATVSVGTVAADRAGGPATTNHVADGPPRTAGTTMASQPDPWPFNITGLYLNQTHAVAGETVTTWVNVTNTGEGRRGFQASLMTGDRVLSVEEDRLEPGETDVVAVEHRFDQPGEYDLTVGGKPVGTLHVLNGSSDGIRVVEASLEPTRIRGDYNATVWMALANPANRNASRDVTVTVDGEPVVSRRVSVPADEQRQISVEFPAREGRVAVDDLDLGRLIVDETLATENTSTSDSGPFEVTDVHLNQSHAVAGETVTTWVNVSNVGEWARTYTTILSVDGHTLSTANTTLLAGESDVVAVEHRFDQPGEYELSLDSGPVGTLTVLPGSDERPQVVAASMSADWVRTGYNATARATVANPDERSATRNLTVTVDGEPVATRTVRIPGDSERRIVLEFPARVGRVAVEGVHVGRLNVSDGPETATASRGATRAAGPGFGLELVAGVLVALLLAGGVARVRRYRR